MTNEEIAELNAQRDSLRERKPHGRPLLYRLPRKRMTLEIPVELVQWIDAMAENDGVTRTKEIEAALEFWVNQEDKSVIRARELLQKSTEEVQ